MTIRAHFDGKSFVPREAVNVPVGAEVILHVESAPQATPSKTSSQSLNDLVKSFPVLEDVPEDLAEQHDHYLYGTPKRP